MMPPGESQGRSAWMIVQIFPRENTNRAMVVTSSSSAKRGKKETLKRCNSSDTIYNQMDIGCF